MTSRITVCVMALLLAGCSGGGDAVQAELVDAPEVDAVDAPRIVFEESWGGLDADQQSVYCQTHALIGSEDAHDLFVGRLGEDAEVPTLDAWSALLQAECPSPDISVDEPEETEVEEQPEAVTEPTPEEVPEPEPALPEVPRLDGEVVPATPSAEALLTLAEDNVGAIIYLDVLLPADDISAEEDEFFWVSGSWGLDDDESGCREFPDGCGAEYLLEDVGSHTDSGFHWERGEWRLFGYFSVPVIAGPHQGSWSVNLRAIPIESVPR